MEFYNKIHFCETVPLGPKTLLIQDIFETTKQKGHEKRGNSCKNSRILIRTFIFKKNEAID